MKEAGPGIIDDTKEQLCYNDTVTTSKKSWIPITFKY